MLKILKRIVQDVTSAPDLFAALHTLVDCVSRAIYADAVSVFLIDSKHNDYVLIATKGLSKDAEFVVRMPTDRGVISRASRRTDWNR